MMESTTPSSTTPDRASTASRPITETILPASQPVSNNPSASPPKTTNASLPASTNPVIATIVLQEKPAIASGTPTPNSNPRLRSSIACARCRKSKIKCTNAGAGTTCEACAHGGRECIYPAPGTGGIKREIDGDESGERIKRPRVRKSEPIIEKIHLSYAHASPDQVRTQFRPQPNSQLASKQSLSQPPVLGGRVWTETFELFQLHYGTELSFLHAPTFLPRLADDPVVYAAMMGREQDSASLHLLQLGILTLTARHHDGLPRQHLHATHNGSTPSVALATSEHFATTLKDLLVTRDVHATNSSLESPSLAKIQALLMLSLYEWSVRRGSSAWIYHGIAIRMAQAMEILTEDLDVPASISTPLTGHMSSTLFHTATYARDLENSETFVQEEAARRTAWSCFLLDRYFSNGSTRPISMVSDTMVVQMPCGEKTWVFGDRVCTPFFNGSCSQHRERTKRKFEHSHKQDHDSVGDRTPPSTINNMISRIPCEYDQDEGLISRFVRIVDIWGEIARWSYQGGKTSGLYAPWDDRSRYWTLKGELQKFVEEMPRSFRFTKANSQAHLVHHTSPPYTLLHTVYSICKLVMLREFLPFSPTKISSPSHLDEIEIREANMYNRRWHSSTLNELFKVAHDLLELIQTCKARSVLPVGPMMGFGIYLVSFIGVYALHFPQMDSEGLVFGQDMDTSLRVDRQVRIIEALQVLASLRAHLPMAEHWFRTVHRAHRYYKQVNTDKAPPQFPAVNRNSPAKDDKSDPTRSLDSIFQDLGASEDENVAFVIPKEEPFKSSGSVAERAISPQPLWKPVNTVPAASRRVDPLDRAAPQVGPQVHAKWYQAWGDPLAPPKASPGYEKTSYALPPNTLPPINSSAGGSLHTYPPTPPSAPPFKSSNTEMVLSFSGEDIAIFIDARSDKDLATIKAGWKIIKDNKEQGVVGSPNHRAQEMKRMEAIGAGWIGRLWQWS